jgi:hypothetical protein
VAVTTKSGGTVYVHERGCLRSWKKEHGERGVAAPILDRRRELTCAQCGRPGGAVWAYQGRKVRLHSYCEDAWLGAH